MAEDGVIAVEDELERTAFAKEKRWPLLTVLAWIATRGEAEARRAFRPDATIYGVDLYIAISSAADGRGRAYGTVGEAWRQELAPAISDGKLSGSGSIVTIGTAHERREVGFIFPSPSRPREADHLKLAQRGHEVALTPTRHIPGQSEWRDLIFPTADIYRLWPAPTEAANQEDWLAAVARLLAEKDQPSADIGGPANLEAPEETPAKRARPNTGEMEADYLAYKAQLARDPSREEARAWRSRLPYHVTQDRAEAMRRQHLDTPLQAGRKPRG
jgi:hypothetical protein